MLTMKNHGNEATVKAGRFFSLSEILFMYSNSTDRKNDGFMTTTLKLRLALKRFLYVEHMVIVLLCVYVD